MTAEISILLLGPPEITWRGEAVSIPRRSTRALLYFLAARGGAVGREEFLPLLWEDEPEEAARRRLRETLSRLRHEFHDLELIHSEAGLVKLNRECVQVDLIEFKDLIDQAGRLPWQIPNSEPLPDPILNIFMKARQLWRSPHFMAGANLPSTTGLDDWLRATTSEAESQLQRVLVRLSEHHTAKNEPELALQFIRPALAMDELNEELQHRAISLMIATGRRSEARDLFDHIQKLMRSELDTSPTARIVNLYREIRGDRPVPLILPSHNLWRLHSNIQTPFVGRQVYLAQLSGLFTRGGGAFIFGESGQGKTRLLEEFTSHLTPAPRLLISNCRPAESNLPFQPFIELLRQCVQPNEWLLLARVWIEQLSVLLPELGEQGNGHFSKAYEEAGHSGQVRALIMEAIRQVFLVMSRRQRLLICLDDAHWSDEASLATIAYLLERPPFNSQAFFAVASRIEESNPDLDKITAALKQSHRAHVILLNRLNLTEIDAIIQHATGQTPSNEFTRHLAEESGGNPLYILEILLALLSQQTHPDLSEEIPLPLGSSLQALIHARLDRLTFTERETIDIAALIGNDFHAEILADVSQRTLVEVSDTLELLEQRHLITSLDRGTSTMEYGFIHHKFREVVLSEIKPLRKRWLHLQLAQAMELRALTQNYEFAALLAQQYEGAGETSKAFDYWLQAARRARSLFALADASHAFARAERLLSSADSLSDQQLHDLFAPWTEISYENEDALTIQRLNTQLLELGSKRNSPLLTGTALDGLSDACLVSNQLEKGLAYTSQAIPYLEKSGDPFELMDAYNHRGVFNYFLSRFEPAIESFQDALALGAGSSVPAVVSARGNAHYQLCICYIFSGWPARGLQHALHSQIEYQSIQRDITLYYNGLAFSRYFLGMYEQARQDSQAGIEVAERTQAWRMLGYLYTTRSMIEQSLGNVDASLEHAEKAIILGETYQHPDIVATGQRLVGDIYRALNAPNLALKHYQDSLQSGLNQFFSADHRFRLGSTLAALGDVNAGTEHILRAINDAERSGAILIALAAKLAMLTILIKSGQEPEALKILEELELESERRSLPFIKCRALFYRGKIAAARGDLQQELSFYQASYQEADQISDFWLAFHTLMTYYQSAAKVGTPDPKITHELRHRFTMMEKTTQRPEMLALMRAMNNYK